MGFHKSLPRQHVTLIIIIISKARCFRTGMWNMSLWWEAGIAARVKISLRTQWLAAVDVTVAYFGDRTLAPVVVHWVVVERRQVGGDAHTSVLFAAAARFRVVLRRYDSCWNSITWVLKQYRMCTETAPMCSLAETGGNAVTSSLPCYMLNQWLAFCKLYRRCDSLHHKRTVGWVSMWFMRQSWRKDRVITTFFSVPIHVLSVIDMLGFVHDK